MTESRGRKIEERGRIERRAMRRKTIGWDREIGENWRRAAARRIADGAALGLWASDDVIFQPLR